VLPLSRKVIKCAFEVHRYHGPGYLEAVYENSLAFELDDCNISFQRQAPIQIHYKNRLASRYIADFIIEGRLLLELKATKRLTRICSAQLLHYLKASGIQVGLLLNFGANSLEIKRMVQDFDDMQNI
jgi:GxxExxY protein